MKKRLLFLLLSLAFLASCSSGYAERREETPLGDRAYDSAGEAKKALDALAELPSTENGATLLFAGVKGGETVLEISSDVARRFEYEQRLEYLWYKPIAVQPETGDRISTHLHPTGWRVAIYDNRRNAELQAEYGTNGYVWQARICRIKVEEGEFPPYPESGKALWLDREFDEEFSHFPRELLTEDFPELPDCSILTDAGRSERGLSFTFITTHADYEKYIKDISFIYNADSCCYADEENNYFYTTYRHITVIEREDKDESEASYSDEMKKTLEKQRHEYYIDELPKRYGEDGEELAPDINGYCKITILFVDAEWVPEWWSFG